MGSNVIAALDIGSHSINALIAKHDDTGLAVLGYGQSPSVGFRKGMVSDIEACALSIKSALNTAENMAGIGIKSAYVGFSGGDVYSENVMSSITVKNTCTEDAHKRLLNSCSLQVHDRYFLLHLVPREYAVDGLWGIAEPIGMNGSRVEIEAHLIMGRELAVQNLLAALYQAGIQVKGLFFNAYVFAHQLLQPAEKEIGYLLADIGSSSTGLCWYHRGKPWVTLSLPVGSGHITSDLAIGLHIPVSVAEEIKIKYGLTQLTNKNEEILIQGLPNGTQKISGQLVYDIIEARVNELIELINNLIKTYGQGIVPAGIVLMGRGTQMPGLMQKISAATGLKVRTFKDIKQNENLEEITALQIMEYGVSNNVKNHDNRNDPLNILKERLKGVIYKLKIDA